MQRDFKALVFRLAESDPELAEEFKEWWMDHVTEYYQSETIKAYLRPHQERWMDERAAQWFGRRVLEKARIEDKVSGGYMTRIWRTAILN